MNEAELKQLIDRYFAGTATEQENQRLFDYYESFQSHQDWDEQLMGNEEETRLRILLNTLHQVDAVGQESVVKRMTRWRMVAAVAALILLSVTAVRYLPGLFSGHDQQFSEVVSGKKAIKVRLPDGSSVWLNAGSKLKYPSAFDGDLREVTLEGEAFFEVVHLSTPFIVHAGEMTTHVLGTSFNVRTFANDPTAKVSVVTGKVGVSLQSDEKKVIFLEPNELGTFDKRKHSLVKTNADARAAVAWTERRVKFRNTPFPEAIAELNRVYNIKIAYDKGLRNCVVVFADFTYTERPSAVVNMLARSLGGRSVQRTDGSYNLSGKACN